jgi:predicted hotdog family 3-hydroxylacyl-ACP dehydratase
MGLKSTTSCLGYQQITSLSSAQALTVPRNATRALIAPLTQTVRWRDDGVAPTASVGMPAAAGTYLSYDGDLNRIRFIEVSASAELNITYYA